MAELEQDQRTERATPRRRAQAREEGQVALSSELVAAILTLGWLLAIAVGGGALSRQLGAQIDTAVQGLAQLGRAEWSASSAAALLGSSARAIAPTLLMFVIPLFILGLAVSYGQIGFAVVPKSIEFDLSKLDPARGWRKIFDRQAFVRVGLALAKIAALFGVVAGIAWSRLGEATRLAELELGPVLAGAGRIVLVCALAAIAAIVVLAACDWVFQRLRHERSLRMSRQEIREEQRNMEGDPHIRARVRRVQREMSRRRMMADVPKATVVITNPTHYAVAILYERHTGDGGDENASRAPRVVAKGVEHVAHKIRAIATAAGVPIHEDPPLARALHAQCEIGDEVPVGLYKAVAGVLAYVYHLRDKARGRQATRS